MFGYIAAYNRHTLSLYLNVDNSAGDSDDNNIPNTADEYLFNSQSTASDEDMPPPLTPLFSYC